MSLLNIKAGDRVWMQNYLGRRTNIRTVAKVTPTQIVIQVTPSYQERFRRANGYRIGMNFTDHIEGLATADECAAYDQHQATLAAQREAEQHAAEQLEASRLALAESFRYEHANVSTEQWGEREQRADRWSVEIHYLTADQVRDLAKWVSEEFPLPKRKRSKG